MISFKRIFALLSCAAAASVTHAGTVNVVFDNPIFANTGYDNVVIKFPGITGGTVTENVLAGRFKGKGTTSDFAPGIFVDNLDSLYMYCYDVYESINSGWSVKYTVNFNGVRDRTLDFIGAVNAVLNTGQADFSQYAWLHPANSAQSAAIQLGIWESLYETTDTWNLASGTFSATGIDDATNVWLNSFIGSIASSPSIDKKYVMTFEAAGAQDMITGDPPANVPEPGTLALVGAAVAALGYTRRKKTTRA